MRWRRILLSSILDHDSCLKGVTMFLTTVYRGIRLALFACTLAIAASTVVAQSIALQGHLPALLDSAQRLNRVDANQQVSLALVLPLRNQDQLADLLHR